MTVIRHEENTAIIDVGNYRIEPGPPRITDMATEELLDDENTAPHYRPGLRDADGKVIAIGKEFTYLDWGGNTVEGKRVFYIYKKTPINSEDEEIDGEPNPHFVPSHVREAAEAGEHGDNRVAYDYKWEEVGTRATEEEAVEYCENQAE